MAFYEKNIITCVEIGTSKICALHGTCDKAGNPVILGFGQTSPEGSVCKSDIVDYQTVTNALEKALGDASYGKYHPARKTKPSIIHEQIEAPVYIQHLAHAAN